MMSTTGKPRGHLQVKGGKNGRRRAFYAFWWDAEGKHGRCLGPAHVRDTGRRTARKAVIWRAGDGPKPTPEHVTPKEAEDLLDDILRDAETIGQKGTRPSTGTLRETLEGWVIERSAKSGLKRTTLAGYDHLFGRLYRDFGADTPIDKIAPDGLVSYFEELTAEKAPPGTLPGPTGRPRGAHRHRSSPPSRGARARRSPGSTCSYRPGERPSRTQPAYRRALPGRVSLSGEVRARSRQASGSARMVNPACAIGER
jgi:hypothetical protein